MQTLTTRNRQAHLPFRKVSIRTQAKQFPTWVTNERIAAHHMRQLLRSEASANATSENVETTTTTGTTTRASTTTICHENLL